MLPILSQVQGFETFMLIETFFHLFLQGLHAHTSFIMFRIVLAISLIAIVRSAPSPYYTRSSVRTPTSYVEQYLIVPDKNDPYRVPLTQVHHIDDFKFPKEQQVFYHNPQSHSSLHKIQENSAMWQNLMKAMKPEVTEGGDDNIKMQMTQIIESDADAMASKISQRETKLMGNNFNENPIVVNEEISEKMNDEAIDNTEMSELMNKEELIELMRGKTSQEVSLMISSYISELMKENDSLNLTKIIESTTEVIKSEAVEMDRESKAMEFSNLVVNEENRMEVLTAMMQILQNSNLLRKDGDKSEEIAVKSVELTIPDSEVNFDSMNILEENLMKVKEEEEIKNTKSDNIEDKLVILEDKEINEKSINQSASEMQQKLITENFTMTNMFELLEMMKNLQDSTESLQVTQISTEVPQITTTKSESSFRVEQKLSENNNLNENEKMTQMLELLQIMKDLKASTELTTEAQLVTTTPSTETPELITTASSSEASQLITTTLLSTSSETALSTEAPQLQPKSMQEIMQEIIKINEASMNIMEMIKFIESRISNEIVTTELPEKSIKIAELVSNVEMSEISSAETPNEHIELDVLPNNSDSQGETGNVELRLVEVTTEDSKTAASESTTNKSESTSPTSSELNLTSDESTEINENPREGRMSNSPTLFLHNNRFYVVSGAPEFYANFDAYQKPRTPIFSLQELQPIKPIDKNTRVQRVEPFRIYVDDDKTRNVDNEPISESQARDIEIQLEARKLEQSGKGCTNIIYYTLHNSFFS